MSAGAGHKAEIERADAGRGALQDRESVPPVLERAQYDRRFGGERRNRLAVLARERASTKNEERSLNRFEGIGEFAAAEIGEALGPGADIAVGISQIGLLSDQPDREIAGAPALADARVEDRRLAARIGADDQQRIGLVDTGDGRIEQVARSAPRGIER